MKFFSRIEFIGKNMAEQDIVIPAHVYIGSDDRFILWDDIPVCTINSQITRDYFVWADDGNEHARISYENTILFFPRIRSWYEEVPVYDDTGREIGKKNIYFEGRFTPTEIKYIKTNFSKYLLNGDAIVFNSLFYIGSDIKEIKALSDYLDNSRD